jgi:serine/threonine protein kinase
MWNENTLLRNLRHPSIVKYEGFAQNEEYYIILMELCQHGTLQDLLYRRGRLSEPEARYFMIQILDSVEFLHSNLVIHRDLKLGNIFLQSGLRVKLGDFGLAAQLSHRNERREYAFIYFSISSYSFV